MRFLFTAAIFLGSCLLFLVQPMAARIVLPAFGGTPAVWTASVVFFQAALLLGYAYAHAGSRKLGPRRHAAIHLGLVALAGVTLPFATRVGAGAAGQASPALALIGQLALLVGPAFLVVSAGAPTLQRWFADTRDPQAKDPYFLYSASNVGSMVALLAYPFLVEPRMDLGGQTRLWAFGYGGLFVLLLLSALALWRSQSAAATEEAPAPAAPIENRRRLLWIVLSAVPSSLLLGVTQYLSANIAPIPLLWVVPLALYLLTFIFAFARRPLLSAAFLGRGLPMVLTPLVVILVLQATEPLLALAGIHLLVFFVAAWMCHARLAESRPEPAHLTEFFLWVSVGGVIGGAFNALVAPLLFNDLLEYPLALVLAALLRPSFAKGGERANRADFAFAAGITVLTAITAIVVAALNLPTGPLRTGLVVGLPAVLAFVTVDRPWRYGVALAGILAVTSAFNVAAGSVTVALSERSFFGVHRVLMRGEGNRFHELLHGNTVHGLQDMRHPETPLTYYHPTGPIGRIMRGLPPERSQDVGLVGLGVGSLAAYGRPGQRMTYFEIDPVVERIARDERYFTFLRDTQADLRMVLGDARLTLGDVPDATYGLIALDAFSSDAIPVHLLTKEAMAMYLRKLRPDGLLAVHISNRYLDLSPVLAANAKELGLVAYLMTDGTTDADKEAGKQPSNWALLARTKADAEVIVKKDYEWSEIDPTPGFRTWTDDFSNVLDVYRGSEE
ncbi:MAG: fused MFS/spermidine synthase [Fimbriimonas sp.]